MGMPQERGMITKNIGMLLLAIYLILAGIMALFHVEIPAIVTGPIGPTLLTVIEGRSVTSMSKEDGTPMVAPSGQRAAARIIASAMEPVNPGADRVAREAHPLRRRAPRLRSPPS